MEDRVLICAISYRVLRPDPWTVLFIEEVPLGSTTRMMFHRPKNGLWQFYYEHGVQCAPCAHIVAGYEWCKARIAEEHATELKPDVEVVPHHWEFDEERKKTYCLDCGLDMNVTTRYRSCGKATPK